MKTINVIMILTILASCGDRSSRVDVINGQDGLSGSVGARGERGFSAVVSSSSFAFSVACPTGGVVILAATDSNESGALDIEDTNIVSSTVCNGLNGSDGQDGADGQDGTNGTNAPPTAFSPVDILNPCGINGSYDEVLVKLASGQVLASFSQNQSGQNTRFTILLPDTGYVTTDGTNCSFKVNSLGDLYDQHN